MAVYFVDSSALVKRYISENELNAAAASEGLLIKNPNDYS